MSRESEREAVFVTQQKYLWNIEEAGVTLSPFLDRITRISALGGLLHLGAAELMAQARGFGYNVKLIDIGDLTHHSQLREELHARARDNKDLLVLISAMDINTDTVNALAENLPTERTLIGGVGPTYAPELFPCHYLAQGRCTGPVFHRILDDFSTTGRLERSYWGENSDYSKDVRDYPELNPDYSPLADKRFLTNLFFPMEVSVGCHQSCEFCHDGLHGFPLNGKWVRTGIRVKPLRIIEAQLKMYREVDRGRVRNSFSPIIFYDQNLMTVYNHPGYGRDYILDLMALIKKYGFYWGGEGTIGDVVANNDTEVLKALGERCLSILVGAENILGSVPGSPSKNKLNENFEETVKMLRECRVPVMWSLIGGLDDQEIGYYQKLAETVTRLGLSVVLHTAVARPGTPYYEQLKTEGRVLDDVSAHRDMKFHIGHKPSNMTPGQALGGHTFAHMEIFNPVRVAGRFVGNLRQNGLLYAFSQFGVDAHGLGITPRLHAAYGNELKSFKQDLKQTNSL